MGVVADRRVAVRLDLDGGAILDLESLGHPRYARLAHADHRRVSEWVSLLCTRREVSILTKAVV